MPIPEGMSVTKLHKLEATSKRNLCWDVAVLSNPVLAWHQPKIKRSQSGGDSWASRAGRSLRIPFSLLLKVGRKKGHLSPTSLSGFTCNKPVQSKISNSKAAPLNSRPQNVAGTWPVPAKMLPSRKKM